MRFLREPLVHFLVGGALLFGWFDLVGDPSSAAPDRIVVSETRVEGIAASFERVWLRPPTPEELSGLIEDYIREEILYREALSLGLDRDDLVVRRRLRQKMEFLNEDLSGVPEPTDAELEAYLATHAERFRIPSRTNFDQIFLDPERSHEAVHTRAHAVLAELREGRTGVGGDATLLPARLERATPREIDQTFGQGFAQRLEALEPGTWSEPLDSSFGLHLVRVRAREPAHMPALATIRDTVVRDWTADRREAANERFHRALRTRYQVEVHAPTGASAELGR